GGVLAFELVLWADGRDAPAIGRNGSVREDPRVAQLRPAARARRAGAGDDLRRVDEELLRGHRRGIYGTRRQDVAGVGLVTVAARGRAIVVARGRRGPRGLAWAAR